MASSLVNGPLFKFLRVARRLTVTPGGSIVLTPSADAPANPVAGMLYVNSSNVLRFYNGTAWVSVTTS